MCLKRTLAFTLFCSYIFIFANCYGRKVLGNFDELTIGPEYEGAKLASAERSKTQICDKTFLNAFQVGIHGAKEGVIHEALRAEMSRDPRIVAFNDVVFEHRSGCWFIEYTPELRKK
ncbi:hypothetical protein EHQ53_10835 [Leptospira langatensis]|uniref:Uncharacterized protein n=1 Tax=Leptospira langatensis TaxID=2484983 RepID=A0A5F1ZRR2_9LEPT|nr:hypothetical protein EHO57_15665 [Leptospira langatensis]TGL40481.1 hypothetical protein EHQ53_10835 [Leptospira langatensis]